jgi:hypothetical protein
MINNYWEEQDMNQSVHQFHDRELQKMGIPEWIKNIECPFCKSGIPLKSIRTISLCLNTRNFGDVAVEVLCESCSKMDTLYYREGIDHVRSFANLLMKGEVQTTPIIEEEMYANQYNNIVEKMVEEQGQEIRKIAFQTKREKPDDDL